MEPEIDVFGTQTSAAALAFGLQGVVDWSVQQPFLDVFKTARPWHGHTDARWGAYSADDLAAMGVLDQSGWITRMPSDVDRIEAFILTEMPAEAAYTGGLYRLSYDGTGDITVFGARIVSQSNGEIWFEYQPTGDGMVTISIGSSDPQNRGDYLRNIEVVKQEHVAAFDAGALFNPIWLDVIRDAHALRFMDWQETNNSDVTSWSDRPMVADYTYHGGVPLEIMVALANETGTEPWFNIPWHADATYIRAFATYVRDHLDPDLRAHIELSNEVWNWMFTQARDAAQSAQARFGQDIGDGWMQEYGARSAEMARILDEVYSGAEDQLVKVIATHTYWPGLETSFLEAPAWQAQSAANDAPYLSFDTYAVSGYFGNNFGTDEKAGAVLEWIAQSEAQAVRAASALGLRGAAADAYVAQHRYDLAEDLAVRDLRDGSVTGNTDGTLQDLFALFRYHKAVSEVHGLDLVMYEGGTHVVGVGSWVNNDTLTDFFNHLNYSEGMGQLYTELLEGWEDAGGTLFNAFVDVSAPSKWGSWGTVRHLEDSSARHDAVVDFLRSHPAPDHMKDGAAGTFVPDPVDDPIGPSDPQPDQDPQPDPAPQPDRHPQPEPDPAPVPSPTPGPSPTPAPLPEPAPIPDGDVPLNDVREYVFGNSLYVWAVGNPELSVSYWMDAMAEQAGKTYASAMQTGMLTLHDNLPARPHITIDGVTEAWDPDTGQSFAEAGFNQITLSPVNFVQDQTPDSGYWIEPETTPVTASLRIIDWAIARAPGATVNIYETWPEMEGFIGSFPPSDNEFASWVNYLKGDWHQWWVSLTEMIRDARPDLDIRLISVGPKLIDMLEDPGLGLSGLSPTDLFQDSAPHGTPTLYLLSSMIHYSALYGTAPARVLDLPDSIHPTVAARINAISEWLSDGQASAPARIVDAFADGFEGEIEGIAGEPNTTDGRSDRTTPGDDLLLGTDGPDLLFGGGGDDTFHGSAGQDRIFGGAGTDTVILQGLAGQYSLSFVDGMVRIEDRMQTAGDATHLQGIERIEFAGAVAGSSLGSVDLDLFDGVTQLDIGSLTALTELYIACFNRAPDALGLFYWGNLLADGMHLDQIAEAFFDQPETRSLYGDLDDLPGFVTAVYQNVLGRDPDVAGLSYWLNILETGADVTPASFIQAIIAGAKSATGDPADAAYLANKALLGGHFAVTRGMSDVDDARAVMQAFDGSADSLTDGLEQADAFYADAMDAENGAFLMQLVGVGADPFVM